jgi:hypothetical protein
MRLAALLPVLAAALVLAVGTHYHEHYYGAFVHDADGNNIEAVCQTPQ